MLAATLILWLLAAFRRQIWATIDRVIKDTHSLKFIALGSLFGPFLGIWFSMISIQATLIGVAATLQSLMPIILLPVMKWGFHENVSTRSVLGTFIAIGGVALLFIVP
jgi:drug/metabolite transporter (DMT)-like permease